MAERNCPFYGFQMYQPSSKGGLPFVLLATHGNQCALVTDAHSPCLMDMEIAGTGSEPVEWSQCPRVGDVRLGG